MGHGDVETGLEKLNETLKDLDYSNKLMQALMDGQKVKQKLLYLSEDEQKENNSSASELLSLGS